MSNGTTKFNVGDRVEFVESVGQVKKGMYATVTESPCRTDRNLVQVKVDGVGTRLFFPYRMKLVPKFGTGENAPTFRVGDTGKTRDGFSYEVIAVRPGAEQPVVCEVLAGGNVSVETFGSDGTYFDDFGPSGWDLIPPPPKITTIYLNISKRGRVTGDYTSAEAARRHASVSAVIVAHPITVEIPA